MSSLSLLEEGSGEVKEYYLVMERDQCVSFVDMAATNISPQAQMSKKSQILYLLINSPGSDSAFPVYCASGKFNLILGSLPCVPTSFPAPRLVLGFCEPLEVSRKEGSFVLVQLSVEKAVILTSYIELFCVCFCFVLVVVTFLG